MWSDALTPLRWLYRGLIFALLMLFVVPTVLCQSSLGRAIHIGDRQLDETMLNAWSRLALMVFGITPQVSGKPLEGPVLIVSNHISWLDIEVLHSVAAMSFVAKAEIAKWPLIGFLASRGGTIYHQRGSHDSASGVIARMLNKLADGGRIAIFPEGGIFPGEDITRFHARMFRVAIEAGCPVQPAMIRYMRDGARDPGMTFINNENFMVNFLRLLGRPSCQADLRFLEPFEAAGHARRGLAERAQAMVEAAYAG